MKRQGLWYALLALGSYALGACGDDGGAKETCSDVCAKQASCDQDVDQATCEEQCKGMLPKMNDDFVAASSECILQHTCDELENDACEDAGRQYCTTDLTPLATTICTKQVVECGGGTEEMVDPCVQNLMADEFFTGLMSCYKSSALDAYASCIEGLDCNASDDERVACAETHLGVTQF